MVDNPARQLVDSKAWKVCSLGMVLADRLPRAIEFPLLLLAPALLDRCLMGVGFRGRTVVLICSKVRTAGALALCLRDFVELAGEKRLNKENAWENASDAASLVCSCLTPIAMIAELRWIQIGQYGVIIGWIATSAGVAEPTCAFVSQCQKAARGECPLGELATNGLEAAFQAAEPVAPPVHWLCALATVSGAGSTYQEINATVEIWNL